MKVLQILFIGVLLGGVNKSLLAQVKHDYTWIFGSNALANPGSEGSIIKFGPGGIDTSYQQLPSSIGSNNSSFSSTEGHLITYSNACNIYNAEFEIMENGGDINPGSVHDSNCIYGDYLGLQNSIMLQDPGGNGVYYWHKPIQIYYDEEWVFSNFNPMYSYIDVTSNAVVRKNIPIHKYIRHSSGYSEAIQHANGEDWWILDFSEWDTLSHTIDDTLMYVFKIDSDSLYFHHEQKIGNIAVLDHWCSSGGQSAFSTDGSTFAMYCPLSGLDLYGFDRQTAMLSNHRNLQIPATYRESGICFSPNNRFIYISNGDKLWQADLDEENLEDGLLLVDEYEPGPGFPANFAHMQLGPDCRIYMNSTNQTSTLHLITHPNEKGEDCGFEQRGFELPHRCQPGSLPNFPHFRIDEDEVCNLDLVASVFEFPVAVVKGLDVFPNPTSGELTIELPDFMSGLLSVRDVTGQVVVKVDLDNDKEIMIDLGNYDGGMYMIELLNASGERYVERVVVY